jgi:hypothetical protein
MSVAMKLAYKQDIKDPLVTQAPVTLLMQGDNQANVIELTLMDGASPASLSGYTATVYLQRADGVQVRCPGTVSGNVATVTLQAECYSVPGQYAAIMKLSGPNELRTVLRLAGYVESDGQGSIIDPSGSIPSYEDIERIMQELEEALQRAETAISGANAAAQNANEKAAIADTAAGNANAATGNANEGAGRANKAAASIEGLTVEASDVAYNKPATATVTDVDGHKHIAFGLRQGVPGPVPTLTFTAKTGNPGTDVVVEQSGTPDAPVVGLTIPRGDPGEGAVSTVDGLTPVSGGNVELSAVRYVAQTLEDAQKVQARKNIGVDGQIYPCTAAALEAMSQEQQAELYTQGYRAIKTENNGTVVLLGLGSDGSLEWLGCNEPRGSLLDNENFAIAQAGYGGTHGTNRYAADRWLSENDPLQISNQDGILELENSSNEQCVVLQKNTIDALTKLLGKYITLAICLSNDEIYCSSSLLPSEIPQSTSIYAETNLEFGSLSFVLFPSEMSYQFARIQILPQKMVSIKWIRLLLGSYTPKTLPPWEAPNKTLETLKCQHFAQILSSNSVNALDLRPTMRLSNPTITQISDGKYLYSCDL